MYVQTGTKCKQPKVVEQRLISIFFEWLTWMLDYLRLGDKESSADEVTEKTRRPCARDLLCLGILCEDRKEKYGRVFSPTEFSPGSKRNLKETAATPYTDRPSSPIR